MTERTNRRDDIVEAAAQLFMRQGYAATSVREIAEAVGVTEAALYYHFKDKRALLQAVVECNAPNLLSTVEACASARSLGELVTQFGAAILQVGQAKTAQLRWIAAEIRTFTPEERALIHAKHVRLHEALCNQVARFVPDEAEAARIAWLLIFTMFGYGQLFIMQYLGSAISVDMSGVLALLGAALERYAADAPAGLPPPDPLHNGMIAPG